MRSCSFDAAVSTDHDGRVLGIDALQIRSKALDLALAVILDETETVFELRWRSLPGESRFPI